MMHEQTEQFNEQSKINVILVFKTGCDKQKFFEKFMTTEEFESLYLIKSVSFAVNPNTAMDNVRYDIKGITRYQIAQGLLAAGKFGGIFDNKDDLIALMNLDSDIKRVLGYKVKNPEAHASLSYDHMTITVERHKEEQTEGVDLV